MKIRDTAVRAQGCWTRASGAFPATQPFFYDRSQSRKATITCEGPAGALVMPQTGCSAVAGDTAETLVDAIRAAVL